METMPFRQQKLLFDKLSDVASYANLSHDDRMAYDADLKAYRDMVGQLAFAENKGETKGYARGFAQGEAKGWAEAVMSMRLNGMDDDTIAKVTGRSLEWIRSIGY